MDCLLIELKENLIPQRLLFSYLKAVLKGTAALAVSGIPVNNDNYDTAITLLQEKFGRKEIIQCLYSKLHNLPKCGNKFLDIQRMGESVEKILRQLEAQGELVDSQQMLIQLLLSKFPIEVIFQLEKSKKPTSPWTMETLRKAISEYVIVQENVHRHVTNVKGHSQPPTNYQQEHVYQGSNVRGRQQQSVNYQQGVYCRGVNLKGHSEENKFLQMCLVTLVRIELLEYYVPVYFARVSIIMMNVIESPQHQNVRKIKSTTQVFHLFKTWSYLERLF